MPTTDGTMVTSEIASASLEPYDESKSALFIRRMLQLRLGRDIGACHVEALFVLVVNGTLAGGGHASSILLAGLLAHCRGSPGGRVTKPNDSYARDPEHISWASA